MRNLAWGGAGVKWREGEVKGGGKGMQREALRNYGGLEGLILNFLIRVVALTLSIFSCLLPSRRVMVCYTTSNAIISA